MEPVHKRADGEEPCEGVPIRADLSAISEAILRCRTGSIREKWLKMRALSSASES